MAAVRPDLAFPKYKAEDLLEGQIFLSHCPERVLPGHMVRELVSNDRVIGGITPHCAAKAVELYESFVRGNAFVTDCRTAEFVKLIENCYRDVNIAFANELSLICDHLQIDVWSAIALANKHPRVSILNPGPGVGGHCIAVDPWFIVDSAPKQARLIKIARQVNEGKTDYVYERILALTDRFREPVVSIFGIAYKPDVGDLRESPSLDIVMRLVKETELQILVCDPMVSVLPAPLRDNPRVKLVDIDEASRGADVLALLVGHRKFQNLRANMFLNKVVVDEIGLLSRNG